MSQRSLTAAAEAGMCNRLRVLLSARAVARATDREFGMRWRANSGCGATFERLFENDWNVRADVFVDPRRVIDLPSTPWGSFPDWFALPAPHVYVYHHGWLIQPKRDERHIPLRALCEQWMNELQPVPQIADRVHEFREQHFRPTMIGVHLRRSDMTLARPDTTGNLAATLRQVDVWLGETPEAGILLCTDDGAGDPHTGQVVPAEGIAAKYRERYGERVVSTAPSSLDRSSAEAIQDALVDLWLLRATGYFVGTAGSSFSELAVFGRAVPAVQTAESTLHYQSQARWLKRLGLYDSITRIGRYEFGRDVPYTVLRNRYKRRLRHIFRRRRRT